MSIDRVSSRASTSTCAVATEPIASETSTSNLAVAQAPERWAAPEASNIQDVQFDSSGGYTLSVTARDPQSRPSLPRSIRVTPSGEPVLLDISGEALGKWVEMPEVQARLNELFPNDGSRSQGTLELQEVKRLDGGQDAKEGLYGLTLAKTAPGNPRDVRFVSQLIVRPDGWIERHVTMPPEIAALLPTSLDLR